ncbi:MAG TPA: sulfatase-like hydrolase/transferase [Sumerlaeia bacterium]|nr:sulfatase-like hydrolase/transferase [Sumerlaeia bacterium]
MSNRNQADDRPNIVMLLSDDQGYWAMACAGNPDIRTPNLDRLAASGMRFENFFCASPVCSPARASILTGRIPSQHGVHDWIRSGNVDVARLDPQMRDDGRFAGEKAIRYLEGQLAFTEILAENGYECALSGKWHLGDSLTPQKGFSHWYTIGRGGCAYYSPDMVRDGKVAIESRYITDLITEDALDYLDGRGAKDGPFYLSVHYTAPHSPWERQHHPPEIFDSYADSPFTRNPKDPPHPWSVHKPSDKEEEDRQERLQGYYAAVTAMDRGIGRILDKLEAMGARENTLVFFTSDNGMNMGHHGIWGKGNGTFPQNMYDTSVKVPAIISRPGRVAEGETCDALLSHYDFMPTLLDYLGLENPEADRLPGKSFAALLRGQEFDQPESVVVYDEYGPVRMIRTRQWKYVHRYPYGPNELYDLANDPDEYNNLVEETGQKPRIEKMKAQLDAWFVRYADPLVDGTREATYGVGQLDLAGPAGKGRQAYAR